MPRKDGICAHKNIHALGIHWKVLRQMRMEPNHTHALLARAMDLKKSWVWMM